MGKEFDEHLTQHPEHISGWREFTERILNAAPAQEWSAELPSTGDYQMRSEKLLAPEDLTPGFYWLVVAHDRRFKGDGSVVSMAPVWVSDLAMIWRSGSGTSHIEGLLLDAGSREPIEGARVRTWGLALPHREIELEEVETVHTDNQGKFRIHASHAIHLCSASFPIFRRSENKKHPLPSVERTFSIYRRIL